MSNTTVPAVNTRRQVEKLRAEGRSYTQISASLGISKASVAYHCRRLGQPVDEKAARRYDWSEIQAAYDTGLSVRDCAAKFGFSHATWHEAVKRGAVVARPHGLSLEEVLVDGRKGTNRQDLKSKLIKAGLKHDLCEKCGINEWLGLPLSLHVHHLNGAGLDNRLENIALLCPNCHSQTENWGGRNKRRRAVTPLPTDPPPDRR